MKRHCFKRIFFIALTITWLIPAHCFANESDKFTAPADLKGAVWTWADETADQQAIFLSKHNGKDWQIPVKISNNDSYNVVPSVTSTADQDLWVVWSSFDGKQSQLLYKRLQNGVWTEETSYYSGLSSNTAPSIGVDTSGKVWLVWAGFDGISDEIFVTTWNGSAFEPGKSITSNEVPDVLPVLGFSDDDVPTIQWQQFRETGYIEFSSSWTGDDWTEPAPIITDKATSTKTGTPVAETTDDPNRRVKTAQIFPGTQTATQTATTLGQTTGIGTSKQNLELELPDFIAHPESAAIHIPGNPVQSLPVRNMATTTGSN